MGFYGTAPGFRFYGNILAGTPTFQGRAADVAYGDGNLYAAAPGAVIGQSWAAWTASGRDGRSRVGDPLFANPGAGDYSLKAGSPAIDAAGGAHQVPDRDAAGAKRPQGAGSGVLAGVRMKARDKLAPVPPGNPGGPDRFKPAAPAVFWLDLPRTSR
jgi:hypothetical protein